MDSFRKKQLEHRTLGFPKLPNARKKHPSDNVKVQPDTHRDNLSNEQGYQDLMNSSGSGLISIVFLDTI